MIDKLLGNLPDPTNDKEVGAWMENLESMFPVDRFPDCPTKNPERIEIFDVEEIDNDD